MTTPSPEPTEAAAAAEEPPREPPAHPAVPDTPPFQPTEPLSTELALAGLAEERHVPPSPPPAPTAADRILANILRRLLADSSGWASLDGQTLTIDVRSLELEPDEFYALTTAINALNLPDTQRSRLTGSAETGNSPA